MKTLKLLFLPAILILLVSCKEEPKAPYQYETNPVYAVAKAIYYGNYYPGIESNVLSLEFFTEGMLDEAGNSVAPGQHLYFEDVFIPMLEKTLVPGEYSVSKGGELFTFYPGETFVADNVKRVIGARIRYVEKDGRNSTQKLVTAGSFTVDDENKITFHLQTEDKKELKGQFDGIIQYQDASNEESVAPLHKLNRIGRPNQQEN